mgnify:CR=1 FL=1
MAYPALSPKVAPIRRTSRPTTTGASPAGAGEFRVSVIAKMTPTSSGRPDHLIDEAAGKHAQERLGIGRPDTRRSLRADDLTDAAVERV